MCFDPITAATAVASFAAQNATLISLAGTGLSAYGSYQQAQGQRTAAKYNAAVARVNAKVAEFKAQDAQDRAQIEAENIGRAQASMRGKQKAAIAANGLDLSSETAGSILNATDFYGLQDQANVISGGEREAWGYRVQGANYRSEAEMQSSRARSISPFGAAAGTLLSGAGSIADKWKPKAPSESPLGTWSSWSFN